MEREKNRSSEKTQSQCLMCTVQGLEIHPYPEQDLCDLHPLSNLESFSAGSQGSEYFAFAEALQQLQILPGGGRQIFAEKEKRERQTKI